MLIWDLDKDFFSSFYQKVTTETSHVKQTSFGDEDESIIAVKPMQPLLRGYKRSIAISPRILHNGQDRLGNTIAYLVCLN